MDLEEALDATPSANLRARERMPNAEVRAKCSDEITRRLCLGMSDIITVSLASVLLAP